MILLDENIERIFEGCWADFSLRKRVEFLGVEQLVNLFYDGFLVKEKIFKCSIFLFYVYKLLDVILSYLLGDWDI